MRLYLLSLVVSVPLLASGCFESTCSEDDPNCLSNALVRKGVERMGGAAGVESDPEQGSRFWIELPAA